MFRTACRLPCPETTGDSGNSKGDCMTKTRFRETVTVFAIAALSLTAVVPAASAQTGKTFNLVVPFEFYAGAVLMPAGEYTVAQTPGSRATQIYDRKGHIASILPLVGESKIGRAHV